MSALKNGALYIRVSTADQTETLSGCPAAPTPGLREEERDCPSQKSFLFELESVSGRPCGPAGEVFRR